MSIKGKLKRIKYILNGVLDKLLLTSILAKGMKKKMNEEDLIKIILLGPGDSGKSTIFRQIRAICRNGYTMNELIMQRRHIYRNLLESIQYIVLSMKKFNIKLKSDVMIRAATQIVETITDDLNDVFPIELGYNINLLWNKAGLKEIYTAINDRIYIACSALYYLNNLERIIAPNYIPIPQDIFQARIRTMAISEYFFNVGNKKICLVDIGGQTIERRKWIHCFEKVNVIAFCVAICDYNQLTMDNGCSSKILDAFMLFKSIIKSEWFSSTTMILFLNKIDIFRRKLPLFPLKNYFIDYSGDNDYESSIKYLRDRFYEINNNTIRLYCHYTCATDTKQFETVFSIIMDTMLTNIFRTIGII